MAARPVRVVVFKRTAPGIHGVSATSDPRASGARARIQAERLPSCSASSRARTRVQSAPQARLDRIDGHVELAGDGSRCQTAMVPQDDDRSERLRKLLHGSDKASLELEVTIDFIEYLIACGPLLPITPARCAPTVLERQVAHDAGEPRSQRNVPPRRLLERGDEGLLNDVLRAVLVVNEAPRERAQEAAGVVSALRSPRSPAAAWSWVRLGSSEWESPPSGSAGPREHGFFRESPRGDFGAHRRPNVSVENETTHPTRA